MIGFLKVKEFGMDREQYIALSMIQRFFPPIQSELGSEVDKSKTIIQLKTGDMVLLDGPVENIKDKIAQIALNGEIF